MNTMERRVSCLKRKSKSSWSYGRSVPLELKSLALACPEMLLGGATFCSRVPSASLQTARSSLCLGVRDSCARTPWLRFIGYKILQTIQ